jgi:hypothetical protein
MSQALRSIAFVAELIHPPVKHDGKALQKLHNSLFDSSVCSYRDFKLNPGGALLSNAAGGLPGSPVSAVSILADRVQVREEQTGLAPGEFQVRIEYLARAVLTELNVNMFVAQQFAVRSVINTAGGVDSRAFILSSMFGFQESQLYGFERKPSLAGLRLAFPPADNSDGMFNIRVESFTKDSRSLFLENVGTFGSPVNVEGLATLGERFDATYEFLTERLTGFVSQFDNEPE